MQEMETWAKWALDGISRAENLRIFLAIVASILTITFVTSRLSAFLADRKWRKKARSIKARLAKADVVSHFTEDEIKSAIERYVVPDCSRDDPSNVSDLRYVADVRGPVFETVDRFFEEYSDKRHLLILADSGMGKTTFCLNYFYRQTKSNSDRACALISLSRQDALTRVKDIPDKRSTLLLLDALDEDLKAQVNAGARLREILTASADFLAVVITCRSQFFANDDEIPFDTGIAKVTPRRGGETPTYKILRLYLMPFDERQIDEYIRRNFGWWKFTLRSDRAEARTIVARVPELAVRPMLLELLPQMVKDKRIITELFDLYQFLVDGWLQRESRWIDPDRLLAISESLALYIFAQLRDHGRDRVWAEELVAAAGEHWDVDDDLEYIRARSLLNRDSDGMIKFAHRSVLEFLVVRHAIGGNNDCFNYRWTDFMRQLFVSWGYTANALEQVDRAREMLGQDLRTAGLVPLSDPPSLPGSVRLGDFPRLATRSVSQKGRHRSIPTAWKSGVVPLEIRDGIYWLSDLEYDLRWRIQAPILDECGATVPPARLNLAGLAHQFGSESSFRVPSYEEFVSLLECEAAIGADLISPYEFYWIADQLGPRQHLVVSVSDTDVYRERMFRVDGPRQVPNTSRKISVFEISVFNDPRQLGHFVAVPLGIEDIKQHV